MSDQLNKEEEDLLQSALATAFEPTPLSQASTDPPAPSADPTPAAPPPEAEMASPPPLSSGPTAADTSISSLEESLGSSWKSEYEAQVSEWRAKSAEQRVKAEEERKKWEELRAKEAAERKQEVANSPFGSGWESLSASGVSMGVSSIVTAQDDESPTQAGTSKEAVLPVEGESSSTVPPPDVSTHEKLASEVDSPKHEKWEDIPSELTSSYPSISFPSDPHSPSSSHHLQLQRDLKRRPLEHDPLRPQGEQPKQGPSGPTFAVFDSTLSRKTRALALFSSLAINVLLPFVNGVMLGFGEIFAKNVIVGWFGWKAPGSAASNVGVRTASPGDRSKRR
ncbi:hypothetical protein NLI96_g11792 [Meripilus lineatus]|uniref:Uncharacterized protein n=1 Tax=Meripilus lineatus TaxID=2056292 RepID=A0AAD5YAI8_9APHY|nr:hypothetical protein NLI96_g11792 [Physisporinus lineatus]